MLERVQILVNHNLYETKGHFAAKFAEALERNGIKAFILDERITSSQEAIIHSIKDARPDVTFSFNRLVPIWKKKYFLFDLLKIPHLSILVDPPYNDLNLTMSPLSIISCVDRFDCEYFKSHGFNRVFFFPHAVESDLSAPNQQERPYDVVMLGSCYDHETLRHLWTQMLPGNICKVLDAAVEMVLSDNKTTILKALDRSLSLQGLLPGDVDYCKLAYFVDNYMRGKDRVELIRAIKNAKVHIFGGKCWRDEEPIFGWDRYFSEQKNVIIHPPIPFKESIEVLKKSKICLNSMPFFKNGSHERIFYALACGSVPITSDNLYIREAFEDGKELFLYQHGRWPDVNGIVNELLSNEPARANIAAMGREKVMSNHTWDCRARQLLADLPPMLDAVDASIKKLPPDYAR